MKFQLELEEKEHYNDHDGCINLLKYNYNTNWTSNKHTKISFFHIKACFSTFLPVNKETKTADREVGESGGGSVFFDVCWAEFNRIIAP